MIARSPSLTWPTQRYCMNASTGSKTTSSAVSTLGAEGHFTFTGRSVTPVNCRNTLILKVLHSLQTLCASLTTVVLRPRIMSPCS